MECGICYAYRLNDLIPDKACDDSRCGQPFHSLCLYEVRKFTIILNKKVKYSQTTVKLSPLIKWPTVKVLKLLSASDDDIEDTKPLFSSHFY